MILSVVIEWNGVEWYAEVGRWESGFEVGR